MSSGIVENPMASYARLKIGSKAYEDAVIDFSAYEKLRKRCFHNKEAVIRALAENDIDTLREISKYFYRTNGIYQKVVNYFATMYRFDWYMVPEIFSDNVNEDKVTKDFVKVLDYFDNSNLKKTCGELALKVIRDGVCYGYAYEGKESILIQELPWKYCRSRFKIGSLDAIEFDMSFFDTKFPDVGYRMKVLDLFPPEFKKGYMLYKQKKLPPDEYSPFGVGYGHWYLLDPSCAFKFSIFGTGDLPLFVNAIPEIIDLGVAQGIDRQRQLQQLLKIVVQKLPLDKNGDLIFDVDEAQDIHNNAVAMLARAVGVDVLTTFADIDAIDVSDASSLAKDTSMDNARAAAYDAMGTSRNIFNTDGNLSLEKSILADEGSMRNLVYQFEVLFDKFAQKRSVNKKKWNFRLYILETTQYNYQTLSKLYKEQTQMGFSKMLPQIALGQSQSFILNTAFFENEVLHLSEVMLPPLLSSTMSVADLQDLKNNGGGTQNLDKTKQTGQNKIDNSTAGRPAKDQSELSDKTIKNKESSK